MTASLPSSRSRTATVSLTLYLYALDGERRAAAARRLHVRIVELESGALQALDVIDLGPDQIHEAHLVDDALHALDLELAIDLGRLVEVEVVREAGTPTTDDAQAQRHGVLDPFRLADLVDLGGGDRGEDEHRLRAWRVGD